MAYPTNRKPKLSDPRDAEWYPKTFIDVDAKGVRRRFIEGPCEVCGEPHRTIWANFARGAGLRYRFRHLKCAQGVWNAGQFKASYEVSPEGIAQRVIKRYQTGCKARNLEWALDVSDVVRIIFSNCAYCDAPPAGKVGKFLYSGIDRKHNHLGYLAGNCAPCCKRCNFLKGAMPYEEWIAFLDRIRDNWKGQ